MKWDISVSRLQVATKTIRVEAETLEKAQEAALAEAPDTDFAGCVTDYDYEANGGTPVADETSDPNPLQAALVPTPDGGVAFVIGDPKVRHDETCALCSNVMPDTVSDAIEAGWQPNYFIGEEEQSGPVCPDCAEHKCHWVDGELELKHDEEQ